MAKIKVLLFYSVFFLLAHATEAQDSVGEFLKSQFTYSRVSNAWKKYDDSLYLMFHRKNLEYPPKDIYLRVFKSQNELEIWARDNEMSDYKLVHTYHVCALSGQLGPKKVEGDRQVPEGFYFIKEFNPVSNYYLSLLIDYPNYYDRKTASISRLGSDIYIHGGCVTVGCIPMTDEGIKQIYVICLHAKNSGEENIPVHIFPTKFTKAGINFLKKEYGDDVNKYQFWMQLKNSYDFFEKNHRILPVMYTQDGKYVN